MTDVTLDHAVVLVYPGRRPVEVDAVRTDEGFRAVLLQLPKGWVLLSPASAHELATTLLRSSAIAYQSPGDSARTALEDSRRPPPTSFFGDD